jgi:hypothetical protein
MMHPTETAARIATAGLFVFVLGAAAAGPTAQESKSAPIAKELAQALDSAKLEAVAAVDPADPTAFVAALYFPGAQLLVVSAKYSAPQLLLTKIAAKEYRDVYIDLQSASIQGSKVFVQDLLADGLVARPGNEQPSDNWDENNKTTIFDGDWRKARVTEADYIKSFSSADERYAAMLNVLLAKVKQLKSATE